MTTCVCVCVSVEKGIFTWGIILDCAEKVLKVLSNKKKVIDGYVTVELKLILQDM